MAGYFSVGGKPGKVAYSSSDRRSIYALYAHPLTCLRNTEYGIRHYTPKRPRCPVLPTYLLTCALCTSSQGPPRFDLGPTRPASARRQGIAARTRRAAGRVHAPSQLRVRTAESARRSRLPPEAAVVLPFGSPSLSQSPNRRRPLASLRRWFGGVPADPLFEPAWGWG